MSGLSFLREVHLTASLAIIGGRVVCPYHALDLDERGIALCDAE